MFSLELFGVWVTGWLCDCDPLGVVWMLWGTLCLVCFNIGVISSLRFGFDAMCVVIA